MLFRSLHILDPGGPHDGQTVDIRLTGNTISDIGEQLTPKVEEEIIELPDAYVTAGFVDIGAYLGDPGHEEREDIESLRAAAAAGGYTGVVTLPNTEPVRQSVADVAYLLRQNGEHPVDLLPAAALSLGLEGKDMTGMLELHEAGAVLFTDGPKRRVSGSLLKRTLEYARVKGSRVMLSPYDEALVPEGQIHEGPVSTRLGLRGIPNMSETIPLKRALEILEYTESTLVAHLLSTGAGVAEVRLAKARELDVMATVSAHHLFFNVAELSGFDPNFKMLPPLREESDRLALIEGIKDGTIDCIVSNHVARHGEEKDLEFPYADFGALGLQTAFRQALAALGDKLPLGEITRLFNQAPTLLLGQPPRHLRAGAQISLTLFTTSGTSTFNSSDIKGKTENSPLIGRELPGKILGIVNNGEYLPVT
ncbi:MAG: dihydroorotase [Bacteroidota bacterium]